MDELGHIYEDVDRLVGRAEGEGWIRTGHAAGWLERVEALQKEAKKTVAEGKQMIGRSSLCGLGFSNCSARYEQSKLAEEKKADIETVLAQGCNFHDKDKVAYEPVDLILTRSLGALSRKKDELQDVFETVKERVEREENRNSVRTPEVRGWNCTSISRSAEEKRAILGGLLGERRGFTELTCKPDDPLMVEITLEPPVGMNSMFEEVWNWVEDESVRCIGIFGMGGVGKTTLLNKKLGEKTWIAHPGIPEITDTLVHECKYLPLALVTVARAMAGTTDLEDWMNAEKYLKRQVSKFTDMEEEVLKKLEFSYNCLPNEIHKRCFLYLSIFPEDHEIYEDDAIVLWIGEGFLDECDDVHEARTYGSEVFRKLRHACLVEFVRQSALHGETVKMHDLVREMCLWVYLEHGSKKKKVLVQEEVESFRMEGLKKWKDAERISLWLDYLDNLERICRRALPFPALKEIKVQKCPKLKELPLNCDSAKNSLKVIEGEQEWLEGLKWDDPASMQVFSTKFVSCSNVMFF
ncbi:hypothetical protein CRG98_012229 [Punica granatum]|uniref:Uncharacterized protein n=1 Tax=Punica granatum TaxID=22663 RepID=A0A2I0KFR6_PUNGR|nr:hypothetical protein CRG98_012229 [Punica granatum]